MPLLAFIQATTSARLPLHFHCTPDLLRYGRPREAANRSVTERPTALDVSCSAVCTLDRASRIVLSLSLSFCVSEKLPSLSPTPSPPLLSTRDLDPYVLPGYFVFFFLFLSLFSFFVFVHFSSFYSTFIVLYLSSLRVRRKVCRIRRNVCSRLAASR